MRQRHPRFSLFSKSTPWHHRVEFDLIDLNYGKSFRNRNAQLQNSLHRSNQSMATTNIPSSSRFRHPLVDGMAPEWALGWGQDVYGLFVEFSLPGGGGEWVTQRMRWIPAGPFKMGSREDEPGRYKNEGPQHTVTISKPLWVFDTPCTQALWQAVMGANPSYFKDPRRPVETVSWDDAQGFIAKLNSAVPGLELRLMTEAEWEYACRAGAREPTATYAGPIQILGKCNAPILNDIAWYGGNSGVDFDLDNGWDSSGWPEKQFNHTKAGTRKVMLKRCNRWGLYDMLGNVWEWCLDWYDAGYYANGDVVDPRGPDQGRNRVLRGGGWSGGARLARSAYRSGSDPGLRDYDVGFRCAQVQES